MMDTPRTDDEFERVADRSPFEAFCAMTDFAETLERQLTVCRHALEAAENCDHTHTPEVWEQIKEALSQ